MVLFIVGSPKLHTSPSEAVAFLSESINRVIITGRYLTWSSDPAASEQEVFGRTQYSHCFTENDPVNKRRRWDLISLTCQGAVGSKAIKVSASRKEKVERYESILTLPSNRVSSNMRCEVNMIRK